MLAVAEAARNVACAGAKPLGVTDCLNFGNPERPEIMWQFARAVDGIGEACRRSTCRSSAATSASTTRPTAAPFIRRRSSASSACSSTPTASLGRRVQRAGDAVVLLGEGRGRARRQRVPEGGARPGARRAAGARPCAPSARCRSCSSTLADARLMRSAHDCSDGGLAVDARRVLLRHRRHRRRGVDRRGRRRA